MILHLVLHKTNFEINELVSINYRSKVSASFTVERRRRRKGFEFGNSKQYYVKEADVGENDDDQNFLPRLRAPARQ